MRIYRGDLKPDLVLDLTDDGAPVDLTTATSIRLIGRRGPVTVFDRAVTGTTEGAVTMEWQPGDTATTGRIYIEAEVTWPGSKPQTFRPDDAVDIVQDYA